MRLGLVVPRRGRRVAGHGTGRTVNPDLPDPAKDRPTMQSQPADGLTLFPRGRYLRATVSTRQRCLTENVLTDSPEGRALRRVTRATDNGYLDPTVGTDLAAAVLDAVRGKRQATDAAMQARLDGTASDPTEATRLARAIGDATGDVEEAVQRLQAAVAEARRMRSKTYPKSRHVRRERAERNTRTLRNRFTG